MHHSALYLCLSRLPSEDELFANISEKYKVSIDLKIFVDDFDIYICRIIYIFVDVTSNFIQHNGEFEK